MVVVFKNCTQPPNIPNFPIPSNKSEIKVNKIGAK